MPIDRAALIRRIEIMSEEELARLERCSSSEEARLSAFDALLGLAARLDAADAARPSEDEIVALVSEVRRERRSETKAE